MELNQDTMDLICKLEYCIGDTCCNIHSYNGWTDVDFVNKEFTIDKQLIKEKNGVYYIADPKSKAGFRTIPLSDEAYKAIRTLIARR